MLGWATIGFWFRELMCWFILLSNQTNKIEQMNRIKTKRQKEKFPEQVNAAFAWDIHKVKLKSESILKSNVAFALLIFR